MSTLHKRRSFGDLERMDDLQPLLDGNGDANQTEHDLESSVSDSRQRRDSGRSTPLPDHASTQDKKELRTISGLGFSFMLLFTAFNTNGIITVSIPFHSLHTVFHLQNSTDTIPAPVL